MTLEGSGRGLAARTDTHRRKARLLGGVFPMLFAVAGCGQAEPRPEHPTGRPSTASTASAIADAGAAAAPTQAPVPSALPSDASDAGASSCRPDSPWQNVDAGELSFTLPCDMAQKPVAGIDSKVASYESASLTLMYDYGRYSSDLGELEGRPEHREETATIGGKAARIVTARSTDAGSERPFTAAVAFASVGPTIRADRLRLTMSAEGKAAADQETAKRIFRSIELR